MMSLEAGFAEWTRLTEQDAERQPLSSALRQRVLTNEPVRPRLAPWLSASASAWIAVAAGLLIALSAAQGLATAKPAITPGAPHHLQTACASCHDTIHAEAQLAAACLDCHTAEAWVPASFLPLTQDG